MDFIRPSPFFCFIFLLLLIFPNKSSAQNEPLIIGSETITIDGTEEYSSVTLNDNASILKVNGTLIVHGDLNMIGNKSEFIMGPDARVIVFGNFTASNKVSIDVKAYLIIYGNFTRDQSNDQADLNVSNGNIYIFGDQDGWGDNFGTCEEYPGDSGNIVATTCDYGTEDDYIDNYEDLPDDIKENISSCYNFTDVVDITTCEATDVTLDATPEETTYSEVTYTWQFRSPGENWAPAGSNSEVLLLQNVSPGISGNEYRVIIESTNTELNCRIGISPPITVTVEVKGTWQGDVDSDWNNPENWGCQYIPDITTDVMISDSLSNYPELNAGAAGAVHNITIAADANIDIIGNSLEIAGTINNTGKINAVSGSIILGGSVGQAIPENIFLNNSIKNLSIDNPSDVTLVGSLGITGTLKAATGNLIVQDTLVLVSNQNGTALIDGSGQGEILGTVGMQRYIDPAFGYKYLSFPVENAVVGDLAGIVDLNASFPTFFRYNENRQDSLGNDATGWENYTAGTGSLKPSLGYAVNFGTGTTPVTMSVTGQPVNGDIEILLTNHNGKYTNGFNLVGNPYPSPIDWNASGWTKQNIDDAIYFFTASSTDQYTGTYTSYINGISSDGSSTGIIPSMQGFFVHVSDSPTDTYPVQGILGLTNQVRVNDFSQEFYKTPQSSRSGDPLVRLQAKFAGGLSSDHAVIYFDNFARDQFEENTDALKLINTDPLAPNIYSLSSGNQRLSINGTNFSNQGPTRIPLGIEIKKTGKIELSLAEIENMNNEVYIVDMQTKMSYDLKGRAFEVYLKEGIHNSRFFLVFSETVIMEPALLFNEPFSILSSEGSLKVKMNLEQGEFTNLRLSTINGQNLYFEKVSENELLEIRGIKSSGIYLLSVKTENGVFTKKIAFKP